MDMLDHSLEGKFVSCDRNFSLKTVCMLADQLLLRIQMLHENNFVHRDIKPDNFLMGKTTPEDKKTVFIIDLGLGNRYIDKKTNSHIKLTDGKPMTGTARYASINAHQGLD